MRLIDADPFWKPFEDEKEELEKNAIKTSSELLVDEEEDDERDDI